MIDGPASWEIFEREAGRYEEWYASARGRRADRAERSLLAWLLDWFPGARRVLDVGCGTGHFTRWLTGRGLLAFGLDRSPAMLGEAARRSPSPVPLLCADAHEIPLRDGAVDLAVLVTTLEFLELPQRALRESVRVSARGVVLMVLNRWSLGAWSRRHGPQSRGALLAGARDLSLPRLRHEIRSAAGGRMRAVHWRSTLLPRPLDRLLSTAPCGDVIGMAVELEEPGRGRGAGRARTSPRRWDPRREPSSRRAS